MVIHHQRVHDRFSRHPKGVFLAIYRPGIPDAGKATRSPRNSYWHPADGAVDDLTSAQKRDGVRTAVPVDINARDRFVCCVPIDSAGMMNCGLKIARIPSRGSNVTIPNVRPEANGSSRSPGTTIVSLTRNACGPPVTKNRTILSKVKPMNRYNFWILNYASLLLSSGRKKTIFRALDAYSP